MSIKNLIAILLIIVISLPLVSCQQAIKISSISLFLDGSIPSDTFYIDDKVINCRIEFQETIDDAILDLRFVFITNNTTILQEATLLEQRYEIVNSAFFIIPFNRTGSFWVPGLYRISLYQKGKEIASTSFQIDIPPKPSLSIEKIDYQKLNSGDKYIKNYNWEFKGNNYHYEFNVTKSLYDYYHNKERYPTCDPYSYLIYINDTCDDNFIKGLANEFTRVSTNLGFDRIETFEFVVSFIQKLDYIDDRVAYGYEHPKYPIETLIEDGGDCEDTSILLASILDAMDIMNVLLFYPKHAAVGVGASGFSGISYKYEGLDYYYLESTNPDWSLGAIPKELVNISPKIVPLSSQTSIVHQIKYENFPEFIKLTAMVTNIGLTSSKSILVRAGFATEHGEFVYSEDSDIFRLGVNEAAKLVYYLDVSFLKDNLMIVNTFHDGQLTYASYRDFHINSVSSK